MLSAGEAYVGSLSPWPEEFGLDRMRRLLAALGDPQLRYPSIHVVGTNGKSTTTRMIEAILSTEGLAVGAYTSPHVGGWMDRIRVAGAPADFDRAIERVREHAETVDATQFEVVTAAALAEFAEQGVEAAVVEAGLGGRHDATNVLRSPVQVLTNVGLDHTEVLGETREQIAAEKLAVVQPGSTVVLGEPEWEALARTNGAAAAVVTARSNIACAVAAAESFLGRPVDAGAAQAVELPGRLERVSDSPLEIWDGAHNPSGVGYILARLPTREYVVVCSILRDKDAERMLGGLGAIGRTLVATRSTNERALPADEVARTGERFFDTVEVVEDPRAARARALEAGAVLVTGSLYLLDELHGVVRASHVR
jgi:dihydrofolate synthase / folylpolyglutamate synthase